MTASREHAGESRVQPSVGVEREAYGGQAAVIASKQLSCTLKEPSSKPYNHQHSWQGYIEVSISSKCYFFKT